MPAASQGVRADVESYERARLTSFCASFPLATQELPSGNLEAIFHSAARAYAPDMNLLTCTVAYSAGKHEWRYSYHISHQERAWAMQWHSTSDLTGASPEPCSAVLFTDR